MDAVTQPDDGTSEKSIIGDDSESSDPRWRLDLLYRSTPNVNWQVIDLFETHLTDIRTVISVAGQRLSAQYQLPAPGLGALKLASSMFAIQDRLYGQESDDSLSSNEDLDSDKMPLELAAFQTYLFDELDKFEIDHAPVSQMNEFAVDNTVLHRILLSLYTIVYYDLSRSG